MFFPAPPVLHKRLVDDKSNGCVKRFRRAHLDVFKYLGVSVDESRAMGCEREEQAVAKQPALANSLIGAAEIKSMTAVLSGSIDSTFV